MLRIGVFSLAILILSDFCACQCEYGQAPGWEGLSRGAALFPNKRFPAATPATSHICDLCSNSTRLVIVPANHKITLEEEDALESTHILSVRELASYAQLRSILSAVDSATWYNGVASSGEPFSTALAGNILSSFLDLYPNHETILIGPQPCRHNQISLWLSGVDQLVETSLSNRATLIVLVGQDDSATSSALLNQVQPLLPLLTSRVDVVVAHLPITLPAQGTCCMRQVETAVSAVLNGLPNSSHCECSGELSNEWISSQTKLKKSLKKTTAELQPILFTTRQVRAWLETFSANVIHTSYGQISQIGTWSGSTSVINWLPLHAASSAASYLAASLTAIGGDVMSEWVTEAEAARRRSRRNTQSVSPCNIAGLKTLKGANLIVSTIVEDPFLSNVTTEHGSILRGFSKDLLDALAGQLKFNYTLRLVKDGLFGAKNLQGNWTGLIGEVVNCEVDFVSAPLTISVERSQAVDFSLPFMQLGLQVAIRKSYPGQRSFLQFLDPLSTDVWASVFAAGIIASVCMALINVWSPYSYRNARALRNEPPIFKCDCAIDEFSFYNALWFMVGSFAQQGADKQPLSPSGRMVGMTWYLFGLVVINTYIANLAAFLTTNNRNAPISDITSLPYQQELMYGTVLNSQPETFFKTTQVASYKRVWEGIGSNRAQLVTTAQDGLDMVRTSKYAFIWDSPSLRYAAQRLPCDLEIKGNPFDLKGYGFAMPKGSAFREEVSRAVLKLQEDGIIHRLQERWWDDRTQCIGNAATASTSSSEVITLSHVFGLMMVMVGGVTAAMLILAVEVFYYSWKQSRKGADTLSTTVARWSMPRFQLPSVTHPLSSKNNFVATMTRRSRFSRRGYDPSFPIPASELAASPMDSLIECEAKKNASGFLTTTSIASIPGAVSGGMKQSRSDSHIGTMTPLSPLVKPQKSTTSRKKYNRSRKSQPRSSRRPSLRISTPSGKQHDSTSESVMANFDRSMSHTLHVGDEQCDNSMSMSVSSSDGLATSSGLGCDAVPSDCRSLLTNEDEPDAQYEKQSPAKNNAASLLSKIPKNVSLMSLPLHAPSLRTTSLFTSPTDSNHIVLDCPSKTSI